MKSGEERTTTWKTPPKAKIYEALSAIGDKRVKLKAEHQAEVLSSARNKTYIVEWTPDRQHITSNDNAFLLAGIHGISDHSGAHASGQRGLSERSGGPVIGYFMEVAQ